MINSWLAWMWWKQLVGIDVHLPGRVLCSGARASWGASAHISWERRCWATSTDCSILIFPVSQNTTKKTGMRCRKRNMDLKSTSLIHRLFGWILSSSTFGILTWTQTKRRRCKTWQQTSLALIKWHPDINAKFPMFRVEFCCFLCNYFFSVFSCTSVGIYVYNYIDFRRNIHRKTHACIEDGFKPIASARKKHVSQKPTEHLLLDCKISGFRDRGEEHRQTAVILSEDAKPTVSQNFNSSVALHWGMYIYIYKHIIIYIYMLGIRYTRYTQFLDSGHNLFHLVLLLKNPHFTMADIPARKYIGGVIPNLDFCW